jgi:hypothetical protein
VIDVEVTKLVKTTVTEPDGFERVRNGYSYNEMKVALTQAGYYNGTTKTTRTWFIEGVDYKNAASSQGSGPQINWGSYGLSAPPLVNGLQATFNQLPTDAHRDAVIATLGFKKLYDFSASDFVTKRVIKGNPTQSAWVPDWSTLSNPAKHVYNFSIDGWSDKWIRLPVGAEADVLKVVTGERPSSVSTVNVGYFVDAAKGLIDLGFTSKGKVTASGGSAGGELMGAVVNQAPELFGAVVSHVAFVDVLNTMLDKDLPLTPGEWPEWGNPITDKAAFDYIRSYSPYDNVEAKAYPPMLWTAGLNDPRVTYWEPAKMVAKLRDMKTDDNVLLLKTNMGAGHGGKSGRFERLRENAEEAAFILWQMGLTTLAK